jgi:streptomycin 6-kinase
MTEIRALRISDGRGTVRLLAADSEGGALLFQRLLPGKPLTNLAGDEQATASDEQATAGDELATGCDQQAASIAAQVMRQLWRPVSADHAFPTVARWAAGI